MKKTDFYIFLDIDGVLFDIKYIKDQIDGGKLKKGKIIKRFDPKCINALNKLIYELEKSYNVVLVISSSWRRFMEETEEMLKINGLIYNNVLERTPISNNSSERALEILSYLSNKTKPYNLVIIDDSDFNYLNYFKSEQIIKTNIIDCSLNNFMVEDFLKRLNINKNEHDQTNELIN